MNAYRTLCMVVCLAVFLLVTLAGTVVGNLLLGVLRRRAEKFVASPGVLLFFRMFPLLLGTAATLGFALPSFLRYESKQTVETPELHLVFFAGVALLLLGIAATRWITLLYRTNRTIQRWLATGRRIEVQRFGVPIYVVEAPDSVVAVTGIFRVRVFVGKQALASLTEEELMAAVAHEFAHVRSADNLKRLLLTITRLPGAFRHLAWAESAWASAAEFAADRKALGMTTSLSLASALVKIARLKITHSEHALAACHLIPAQQASVVALRVRYLAGVEEAPTSEDGFRWTVISLGLAGAIAAYLLILPTALPLTQRAIEWLVR